MGQHRRPRWMDAPTDDFSDSAARALDPPTATVKRLPGHGWPENLAPYRGGDFRRNAGPDWPTS